MVCGLVALLIGPIGLLSTVRCILMGYEGTIVITTTITTANTTANTTVITTAVLRHMMRHMIAWMSEDDSAIFCLFVRLFVSLLVTWPPS